MGVAQGDSDGGVIDNHTLTDLYAAAIVSGGDFAGSHACSTFLAPNGAPCATTSYVVPVVAIERAMGLRILTS
jgi:hypothetical protein